MAARMKGSQHKYRDRNKGPARDRYWSSGRLEKRKVRHLVRHSRMDPKAALLFWREARKGRVR